ncbi:hypothetical protein [Planosporangium mesophilum]|uniref:Uncharacterized protein n=1 Tax=Planosporangium mesophilum TaxID=689768 RepID=A0A8J3X4E1_9ACTN|nr:hypothetical protein [Planosporangium mesophilum]NJC86815.1 hypothetical protein [Planosporangium mesophilum]GII26524.1 hypothetical protein Pme01_61210 [Planosporangium mesophilum]
MPWSPPDNPPVVADARLDPYRERAGHLFRGADQVGAVYIRVETWWTEIGGRLWWRRWSEPEEGVHGFLVDKGGAITDFLLDAEHLDDELADWNQGRFMYRGEVLHVSWLDDDASQRVRVETLGLDPLDE